MPGSNCAMLAGLDLPEHLRPVKQLGRGAYGTVYLCDDKQSGKQVAVKHVRQPAQQGKSILREIRLLARLHHDNLLHLVDFLPVSSPSVEDVLLVLPYMPADLHKVIQSKQSLTEKHVQVILVQILRALGFLHESGVAHRDLKPANVLVSEDCKVKVCDFGLARGDMPDTVGEEEQAFGVLTEYVVTRWYRAPEVMLLPKQYTSSVDVWSVGCILGEILGRKALLPGKNHIDMISRAAELLGSPSDEDLGWLPKDQDAYVFLRKVCAKSAGVRLGDLFPRASASCLDLLRSLLSWDPQKRPTCAEALNSSYLAVYQPKEAPTPPEPFDWSFDEFRPTSAAVRDRLYRECARFHPEILERDLSATSRVCQEPGPRRAVAEALARAHHKSAISTSAGYPSTLSAIRTSSGRLVAKSSLPKLLKQVSGPSAAPAAARGASTAERTDRDRRPTPVRSRSGSARRAVRAAPPEERGPATARAAAAEERS